MRFLHSKLHTLVVATKVFDKDGEMKEGGKIVFQLEKFLENPNIEQLDKCKVDDLMVVAAHVHVSFVKPILKKDLKSIVLLKLVVNSLPGLP